ncbi:MAG: hypothetical protein WD824_24365 [Cyclobacteriaceae bacterium]
MAQSASLQMGARAHGMGHSSSCLSDIWSLNNNIAGLAKTDRAGAAFSYHAIPTAKFFNRMAAVLSIPVKSGAAGVSLFRFGDDLYNEQVFSMGFANTFGLASLGLKLNYIQYHAEGLGTNTAFTASFGGMATLTPELLLGAHIVNVNQPIINELTEERLPTRLVAGIAFKSDKLILAAEIEKDLHYSPTLKSGLEYQIFKKIAFRTGFNLNPESGFFGLGFKSRRFDLDYSLQFNDPLGLSHQATVACQFKRP